VSGFGGYVLQVLMAIWPLFALIVAGQLMRRWQFPSDSFWPGAERLNYFILFPALLIASLASAPLTDPAIPRLALAVFSVLGIGWIVLLILRRIFKWDSAHFGVFTQAQLRFNTYLGLAIVGNLFGAEGLGIAAVLLALMVPAVNVLSVWALTAERGVNVRTLLLPILKNPLILGCVAGAFINLSGIGLPGGSDRLMKLMAAASLPLGLLCVGAALQPRELHAQLGALGVNTVARLVLMPLLAWGITRYLGLPSMEAAVVVVFFAIPSATASYVLTRQLGGNAPMMAGVLTLQTLLAIASLPLILGLLGF
jgi:predicted permease